VTVPASAAPSTWGVIGSLCGLTATAQPAGAAGAQLGAVTAGPAFLDDGDTPPAPTQAQFICTVQVNAPTHAGADADLVVGSPTTGVMVAQGLVTFTASPGVPVYLCTQILVGATRLYYADPNNPLATGYLDTSPTVRCADVTETAVVRHAARLGT
jgi:hypothetical protein